MKTTAFPALLFLILLAVLQQPAAAEDAPAKTPDGWRSGIGSSAAANPFQAGDEAAAQAKAMLDGLPARFVMVAAAPPLLTAELLGGVKKHFDSTIVYGSEAASPWTAAGNNPDAKTLDADTGVAVWALAGDTDIKIATVKTMMNDSSIDGAYYVAGLNLGLTFRKHMEETARPGKFILTWGDQFTGSNKDFARGLNDGLHEIWPIIGAAAGNALANVVVAGEITQGVNVGVAFAGDFKLGLARRKGPHTPATAERALQDALEQGDGETPFFGLVFNCRRRRLAMMNAGALQGEHDVVSKFFPNSQFFGFYGPGEIGATKTGERAEGVGFSVVAAMLFGL